MITATKANNLSGWWGLLVHLLQRRPRRRRSRPNTSMNTTGESLYVHNEACLSLCYSAAADDGAPAQVQACDVRAGLLLHILRLVGPELRHVELGRMQGNCELIYV